MTLLGLASINHGEYLVLCKMSNKENPGCSGRGIEWPYFGVFQVLLESGQGALWPTMRRHFVLFRAKIYVSGHFVIKV